MQPFEVLIYICMCVTVPSLAVVREMISRLQELRHTDQVQRAYALNCGEGATVSYELQLRVLREFGLPDGAAELLQVRSLERSEIILIVKAVGIEMTHCVMMSPCHVLCRQNPHKFFPEERFGDESPLLSLRAVGRCRVNSSPAMDTMFTELESLGSLNPPLPPPPPPYHAMSAQAQHRVAWGSRVAVPPPSRSFSYPCNHTVLQQRGSSMPKSSNPAHQAPDYSMAQSMGKTLNTESCGVSVTQISASNTDTAL